MGLGLFITAGCCAPRIRCWQWWCWTSIKSKISEKTILLILKLPYAILACCILFSRALKRLTHSLPDKTFISTAKNARTVCVFAILESTFFLKFLVVLGTAVLLTFLCLDISHSETFIVQRRINWMRFSTLTARFFAYFRGSKFCIFKLNV